MSKPGLRKRVPLFSAAQRQYNHAAKAFHAPQRDHAKQPMPVQVTR
jgi:hypothetical protein